MDGKQKEMGKRKRLFKHPGSLKEFGYALHEPPAERHSALRKAVRKYGAAKVKEKLGGLKMVMGRAGNRMKVARDLNYIRSKFKTGGRDKGSATISAVVILIIFVIFVVAAVKMGLTFGTIVADFKTFFGGGLVFAFHGLP